GVDDAAQYAHRSIALDRQAAITVGGRDRAGRVVWKARVHGHLQPASSEALGERRDAGRRRPELGRVVVGEEQDAQHRGGAEGEHDRIAEAYAGYRENRRKRRAWSPDNPGNVAIREELVAAMLLLAGEEIAGHGALLDIGCGTGWWLERLLREGVAAERLIGVELLAERARAAALRAPGARVERADARQLPVPDASCALVTLFTVLSSMGSASEAAAALREARRGLPPGGALA